MKLRPLCILFSAWLAYNSSSAQSFQQATVNAGNLGFTVSNFGTLGRPAVISNTSGDPSMEYPLHSGIEHLFEGGLWIGATVNGQQFVSTSSVDAPTGYRAGGAGFEFTAKGPVQQRSSLPDNDFFSNSSVSHQDLILDFTDRNTVIPGTSTVITDHTPIGADVHLETYAWNYNYADYFVLLNYRITNTSTNTWDSVHLGIFTDMVVRKVTVTQDNGSAYFNKGGVGFIDSLQALYAYEVTGDDIEYTQSYGATQFHGIIWRDKYLHALNRDSNLAQGLPDPLTNYNFWTFSAAGAGCIAMPGNEPDRYNKLKTSYNRNTSCPNLVTSSPNNWIQLISSGAIPEVLPGESFDVVFAVVCAKHEDPSNPFKDPASARVKLEENLGWSRRTFLGEDVNGNGLLDATEDLNGNNLLDRFILPEPPASPKVKIIPGENTVDIYWNNRSVFSVDPISKKQDFEGFKLYQTQPGDDLNGDLLAKAKLIATWDSTGNSIGFNNGFDDIELDAPRQFEGDTVTYHYHYQVKGILSGWQYLFVVTAFDEGDPELNLPPLESSTILNAYRVFAGTTPNTSFDNKEDSTAPGVYPNPYRTEALWDGPTSRTRKIYFYNLPSLCDITVYTISGDVVKSIHHDSRSYDGSDIGWFQNYAGDKNRVFSGGEHAWDLLTENKSNLTQGLYLFTVKDSQTGKVRTGKFAILK